MSSTNRPQYADVSKERQPYCEVLQMWKASTRVQCKGQVAGTDGFEEADPEFVIASIFDFHS